MRLIEVQFAPYLLLFFNYLLIDRIKVLKQNKKKQIIAHIAGFLHTRGVRHRFLGVSPLVTEVSKLLKVFGVLETTPYLG